MAAVDWVERHEVHQPGFRAAYFIGSSVDRSAETPWLPTSDIDIAVVTSEPDALTRTGKFLHHGALLEVSAFPWDWFTDLGRLAASYHLAHGLRRDTIVADPTGAFRPIQRVIAETFCDQPCVERRWRNAAEKVETLLGTLSTQQPWHRQVTTWLFATGVTTQVLLVAALRNPTVRLRYLSVRAVLDEFGFAGLHEELLQLLGCAGMTAARASRYLDALADAFDAAAAVARTPLPFSSDITPIARPLVIDGSRALIASGDHREAIFWIVATFARCTEILALDAPEAMQQRFAGPFQELLTDLSASSPVELAARADDVRAFLPRLTTAAAKLVDRNPDVVRREREPMVEHGDTVE